MSSVTSIILWCSLEEQKDYDTNDGYSEDVVIPRQLPAINTWLTEHHQSRGLRDLAEHMGGPKMPEVILLGGAFNYLNPREFLTFLRSLNWTARDNVRVIVQDEDMDFPIMYRLDPVGGRFLDQAQVDP